MSDTPEKTKQRSILIEVVDNGFIVNEDYKQAGMRDHIATVGSQKVFNTKKQLYNYISENL
jgi:hypothetical protein